MQWTRDHVNIAGLVPDYAMRNYITFSYCFVNLYEKYSLQLTALSLTLTLYVALAFPKVYCASFFR